MWRGLNHVSVYIVGQNPMGWSDNIPSNLDRFFGIA